MRAIPPDGEKQRPVVGILIEIAAGAVRDILIVMQHKRVARPTSFERHATLSWCSAQQRTIRRFVAAPPHRRDVANQPPLVPVALIGADEVHASAKGGPIAGQGQGVDEGGLIAGQAVAVGEHARARRQARAQQGHAAGNRQRRRTVAAIETDTLGTQTVQVRRSDIRVAAAADDAGVVLVGQKENDVRTLDRRGRLGHERAHAVGIMDMMTSHARYASAGRVPAQMCEEGVRGLRRTRRLFSAPASPPASRRPSP